MTNDRRDNFRLSRLRPLAEKRQARWELLLMPKQDPEGRGPVGSEFALWSSHLLPRDSPRTECVACKRSIVDLLEIANRASCGACAYRSNGAPPCAITTRLSAQKALRRHVIVEINLAQPDGSLAAQPACDGRCISQITDRLQRVGTRWVQT